MLRQLALSISIAAALLLAASGQAATAVLGELELTMVVENQSEWDWTGVVSGVPDGSGTGYTVADGDYTAGPGTYDITWESVGFDVDPNVSGSWTVINNSGVTQIFTLSVDVPVLAVTPSSLMFGSSAISVGDANLSGGASLSSIGLGIPLFAGTIDFATALSLYADPYALTIPSGPCPVGTCADNAFLGLPPGTIPGPAASLAFIGIEHRFALSPGDRATFNSVFSIVAVPEPGTGLLLAFGLGALALRRRS